MLIECVGITYKGNVRKNNEDNFFINGLYKEDCDADNCKEENRSDDKQLVIAVCDGMGGAAFGEKASLKAIEVLNKYYQENRINKIEGIENYINDANAAICKEVKSGPSDSAGTTIALLIIENGEATFCNLGDSRIYTFRDNEIMQVSTDHTRARSMVNAGIISEEEAKDRKESHILTQHLGIFESEFVLCPSKGNIKVESGDIIVLCSDGMTDSLSEEEVKTILIDQKQDKPENIADKLITTAENRGSQDNITVVLVKVK